jgi:type IV secretion system protein VirB6
MYNVVSFLSDAIDQATNRFINDVAGQVIAEITPVVLISFNLAFSVLALGILKGVIEYPIGEFVNKSFKAFFIIALALTAGNYQNYIADLIIKTPDEFASVLISNPNHEVQNVSTIIDKAAEIGFQKAQEAWDASGLLTGEFTLAIVGGFILISTCLITAVGASIFLLAKIFLAILVAVGPIFVVCLLFKPTARFFELWAGQVLTYALTIILFIPVFRLIIEIFSVYMEYTIFSETTHIAKTVGGCVLLTISGWIVIWQIPSVAGALAGGLGIDSRSVSSAYGGAGRTARTVFNGGVSTAKGAYAGGSRIKTYMKKRSQTEES